LGGSVTTRRGTFKASFKESTEACSLDYDLMKGGVQMKSLLELEEVEARWFHKFDDFKFIWSKWLRREPHLLNGMLRCTVMPKGGDAGWIRQPYYIASGLSWMVCW
jgi:hypothetical protein